MLTPTPADVTYTREQFYKRLWSMPTTVVAAELGCSDVLIAKICRRYKIPKPYLGYWARLAHGKHPRKTRLPACSDPDLQELRFHLRAPAAPADPPPPPEPEPVLDDDIQRLLNKATSLPSLEVPLVLRRPRPLVRLTRDGLKNCDWPKRAELLHCWRHEDRYTLDVMVTRNAMVRALCIVDTLIRRIEMIGGSVEVVDERRDIYTLVRFGKESVARLRLRETYRQVRTKPSKDAPRSTIDYVPTGLLVLDSGASYDNQLHCRDTPHRRLEDQLGGLIVKWIRAAGLMRIARRKEEEARLRREQEDAIRRAEAQELQRRRDELQQHQEAEQARVDQLVRDANNWRQAQMIRDFLAALRCRVAPCAGAVEDFEADLQWGLQQADRIDPLACSPPSILDESLPDMPQ